MAVAGCVVHVPIEVPVADRRLNLGAATDWIADPGNHRRPARHLAVVESLDTSVPRQAEDTVRGNEQPALGTLSYKALTGKALPCTEGETTLLLGKGGGILGGGAAIGTHQGEVLSISLEAEICMELSPGCPAVFAGSEHHQVAARAQVYLGKRPLETVLGIIGKIPPIERNRLAAPVVELDPVGAVSIFIELGAAVDREEFADGDLLGTQTCGAENAKQNSADDRTHGGCFLANCRL